MPKIPRITTGSRKPFTALLNNTFLHNRSEAKTLKLLTNAYRMYVEDIYVFEGDVIEESLYGGGGLPAAQRGFRKFLVQAGTRKRFLPPWWTAEKREQYVQSISGPVAST